MFGDSKFEMKEVIETTNREIEQVIKRLREIQTEINRIQNKGKERLRKTGYENYSKTEEVQLKEIQEEIVNIKYNLSGTEIYSTVLWRRMNITE